MSKRKMRLSDIVISPEFQRTIPQQHKIDACRELWDKYKRQDRYIVVNPNNVLIDGYVMYLVLKERGESEAEIKICNKRHRRWNKKNVQDWDSPLYRYEPTMYVYGKHIHKDGTLSQKEYVWRVPKVKFDSGWGNDLNIGDKVMVVARTRLVPILITNIEVSNSCPVECAVKKVIRKC